MHIDVRDESIGRLSLALVDKPTRLDAAAFGQQKIA